MTDTTSIAIRRLEPRDAPGVVALVRQIYGTSYVHPELYDAAEIVRLNANERLVSALALTGERVIGHYGLVRPDLGVLAESGEAMVLPEFRHHDLMERMRVVLEEEAKRLRLVGLFGHVVTNHVYSQRAVERFNELPWAVLLGWSPRTFHNMAEPLPQRMSELLYFKYVGEPAQHPAYIPERHRSMCERIYAQLNRTLTHGDAAESATGTGEIAIDVRAPLQRGTIRVNRIGADSASAIALARDQMRSQGAEAVFLQIPLAQPAAASLCAAVEACGFFFSGIGPSFAADGDALLMQWLGVDLDLGLLQIDQSFARELTDYVGRERDLRSPC